MRPLLLVALLSLVAAPAVGAATPAAAQSADDAALQRADSSLSGTVSYLNGSAVADATVLVGSQRLLGNASADELREIAADPPDGVAATATDADGAYALNVSDDVTAEVVVAVSEAGAGPPRSYASGSMDLTIRTTAVVTFESPSLTAEPSERLQVPFSLTNTGDRPIEGLSLSLTVPDGWNHVSASSDSGTYYESNRTFTWGTVEPGETVEASFRIYVGLNAIDDEPRTFELTTFAGSRTHTIDVAPAAITVRYPTEATAAEAPGLGGPAALAALAALAGAAIARRD